MNTREELEKVLGPITKKELEYCVAEQKRPERYMDDILMAKMRARRQIEKENYILAKTDPGYEKQLKAFADCLPD